MRWKWIGMVGLSLCVAAPAAAQDLRILTAGKLGSLRNAQDDARDRVRFEVRRDPGLAPLASPVCPQTSSVEVMSFVGTDLVYGPRIDLPCERWQALPGGGFRYRDARGDDGPVRAIQYTDRLLSARLRGLPVTPGPVGFTQLRLWIGAERFLIRVQEFRRNTDGAILSDRPRRDASAGEGAFWATLGGDPSRSDETIALLGSAAARDPNDGRSRFLLGMMHLYRFGQHADPRGAQARAEAAAARAALEASEPLLWDGTTGDNRVPGFVAAALFTYGVAHDDAAARQQAVADLEAAVLLNPFFNNFDFFAAGPYLLPQDPIFQRIVALVDEAFGGPTALCVVTLPDFCANARLAPHNLEGSLLLFGDVYAKAGRPVDATFLYDLAIAAGTANGWRFLPAAIARRDEIAARIALFQNSDLSDDPPMFGMNEGACAGCHNQ